MVATRVDHFVLPEMGILVSNAGTTASQKANIAKNTLDSRYSRATAISMSNWTGNSPAYEAYRTAGLMQHVVIDVGLSGSNPTGWITAATTPNLTTLATRVDQLLTLYPEIRVLILDNEEINYTYHSGTPAQYVTIAQTIQPVCKAHNVLLASGGVGDFYPIHAFIYRYVKAVYNPINPTAADDFGDTVFISNAQRNAANNPGSNLALEQHITDMTTVFNSDVFDIWNFHMYEPTGDQTNAVNATVANNLFWRYAMECFTSMHPTKRRLVMCNETGPRQSEHPELITSMLDMAWRYSYLYFDIWSGNGVALSTVPLTQNDGSIKPNGQAYADWQNAHYEL